MLLKKKTLKYYLSSVDYKSVYLSFCKLLQYASKSVYSDSTEPFSGRVKMNILVSVPSLLLSAWHWTHPLLVWTGSTSLVILCQQVNCLRHLNSLWMKVGNSPLLHLGLPHLLHITSSPVVSAPSSRRWEWRCCVGEWGTWRDISCYMWTLLW